MCMNTKAIPNPDQPAPYRLSLRGYVTANWSDWLSDPSITFVGSGRASITTVTGMVRDQAALFGLLSFVRDLGVALIAIEFIPSTKETEMKTNVVKTICNAIAIAMGVAIVVLNIVNPPSLASATTMLAIGVAALGLANFLK